MNPSNAFGPYNKLVNETSSIAKNELLNCNALSTTSNQFPNEKSNKTLTIYHGSSEEIVPTYGKGNPKCDYGLAFYCTEDRYQSDLWACSKNGKGITYQFELDITDLKILKLNKDDSLLWLSILLSNRTLGDLSEVAEINLKDFLCKYLTVDVNDYDVIIGYRADDSYFSFAKSFIEGELTYEYLVEALELGTLGYQVAIKSRKAFDRLTLVNKFNLESKDLQKRYSIRDRQARNTFKEYRLKVAYDRRRLKNNVNDIYKFI